MKSLDKFLLDSHGGNKDVIVQCSNRREMIEYCYIMQEIEYLFYLDAEESDRMRVIARKDKGEILEFVAQYEVLISGEWRPVVRYDTAHGFAHKDIIRASGEVLKQP